MPFTLEPTHANPQPVCLLNGGGAGEEATIKPDTPPDQPLFSTVNRGGSVTTAFTPKPNDGRKSQTKRLSDPSSLSGHETQASQGPPLTLVAGEGDVSPKVGRTSQVRPGRSVSKTLTVLSEPQKSWAPSGVKQSEWAAVSSSWGEGVHQDTWGLPPALPGDGGVEEGVGQGLDAWILTPGPRQGVEVGVEAAWTPLFPAALGESEIWWGG